MFFYEEECVSHNAHTNMHNKGWSVEPISSLQSPKTLQVVFCYWIFISMKKQMGPDKDLICLATVSELLELSD